MDIGTGLALFGSAKIAEKLLGPTAEYIGIGVKEFTQKRVENVKKIFFKSKKLMDSRKQQSFDYDSSPIIIKTILGFGSYTEDELIQDYLACLLVSSRTTPSSDDRAAVFGYTLKNMTSLQVRTHFLFYTTLRKLYVGKILNLSKMEERQSIQTYISSNLFMEHVFLKADEKENAQFLYENILHGLYKNGMIENNFAFGSAQHLSNFGPPTVVQPGIVFQPSIFGIELFLWINMLTVRSTANTILDPSADFKDLIDINLGENAFRLPND